MADTLLDIFRKGQANGSLTTPPPTGAVAGPSASTAAAQQISAGTGHASGGAFGAPAAAVSSTPEQVAQAGTRDTLAQGADAAAAQTAQENQAAAGIHDQALRTVRENDSRRATIATAAKTQANGLIADFENGQKTLQGDKDKASAEQLAFNIRLGNDKYVETLQNTAARNRVTDEASFEQEYYNQEFQTSKDLFGGQQAFRQIMAMDADQFSKDMTNMKMDDAMKAYMRMDANRKAQAPYAILSGVVGAGSSYAASPATPETEGTMTKSSSGTGYLGADQQGPPVSAASGGNAPTYQGDFGTTSGSGSTS